MPGTYTFHVNEPYTDLVAKLLKGVQAADGQGLDPRGDDAPAGGGHRLRRAPGDLAAGLHPSGARRPAAVRARGLQEGHHARGHALPGHLRGAPARRRPPGSSCETQLETFDANFAKVDMRRARAANLTEYDVVIIASMIDREALVPAERAVVAAVIWNRLRKDMLLQIDATIQYALGKTKPLLTYDDLEIDSPYNTYKHAGLPPTPISNPGWRRSRPPRTPRTTSTSTTSRATTAPDGTTSRPPTSSSWSTRRRPPPTASDVAPAARAGARGRAANVAVRPGASRAGRRGHHGQRNHTRHRHHRRPRVALALAAPAQRGVRGARARLRLRAAAGARARRGRRGQGPGGPRSSRRQRHHPAQGRGHPLPGRALGRRAARRGRQHHRRGRRRPPAGTTPTWKGSVQRSSPSPAIRCAANRRWSSAPEGPRAPPPSRSPGSDAR